ncbi:unnamed protein product [Microthlaspi erraticum]|uniref:Retrotransposon gag domain-containing protein n=1 Tax=Microthlaspi erraticum TaxID=1685480 RepID=A0A6D2HZV3_9BRAS|nr:unnamed protein product [Microthlaspi erraticum]
MSNQGENRSWGSQSGQDVSQPGNASNTSDNTYMPSEEEGSWYEFMHGYMPESASDSDSTNYWRYQCNRTLHLQKAPERRVITIITTRQSPNGVANGRPQPNQTEKQQTTGANNSQGNQSPGQPSSNGQPPLDPTLTMYVTMMKTLGTYRFEGSYDPDKADTWMQCLDKNFAATRCPTEFKKDVAVYYLEKEDLGWWNSVDRQTNRTIITWEAFQREFRRK